MVKFYFRNNSSIILVHPSFIIIGYGEYGDWGVLGVWGVWSTPMVRRAGLDRGEGQILYEGKPELFGSVTNL